MGKILSIPRIVYFLILGGLWLLWELFTDEMAGLIREYISGGGVIMYGITHPNIIMPSLLILSCIYILFRKKRQQQPISTQPQLAVNEVKPSLEVTKYEEDKGWKDGKPIGECGLIFTNSSSIVLNNCHARLLDIAYEIPHKEYGLHTYPKAEDLICDKTIPAFSKGKIPLFRWKGTFVDKELELVYENVAHKIGYGIANTPILILLNIWAENMQVHYTICKLEDRLGWGYLLTILQTGLQQDNLNLATFQLSNFRKEGSQS